MKKILILLLISLMGQSINSQNDYLDGIIYLVNQNQKVFLIQIDEIYKKLKFQSYQGNNDNIFIDYQSETYLMDDFLLAKLSYDTASFLFNSHRDMLKKEISPATYDYLDELFNKFKIPPDPTDPEKMMMFQVSFSMIKIKFHGKSSELDPDFKYTF